MSMDPQAPAAGTTSQGFPEPAGLTADDRSHLSMLSVVYYVASALALIAALAMGAVFLVGGAMVGATVGPGPEGAAVMGTAMALILAGLGLILLVKAGLLFFCARSLSAQRNRVFCMIVAGLTCLNAPLGTVLGVCTFIVLSRPTVMAAFDATRMRDRGPIGEPRRA